ncbi:MAG TPA: hypothetical protein VHN80_00325 [Kineosporiaceae bacterium]|nr:hypothetical protein [Kineosporiaceae bacterium]
MPGTERSTEPAALRFGVNLGRPAGVRPADAARHADIVALAGALQVRGRPAGTFTLAPAEQTDERVAQLLDSPLVLLAATPEDAASELLRRSRRWGITSWCTHAPSGPALARVIEAVRA